MYLPLSPAGREITTLYGDPGAIRRRGSEIISMGSRMIAGADFLQSLAEESDRQKGEAVEKLREIVGDTHHELRRAGNMYKPTGPILKTYADALSSCQPRVRQAVEECQIRWQSYQSAPGYPSGERPWWAKEEDGSPEAESAAQQDAAKQRMYDSYAAQAQAFDREMDTWETAFDTAVSSIGTILDGSIRDSFWDNVDGFVASALEVLKWAGIILAIAAIIIGGPIVALLASIVGLLTLALTIYQYSRGDTGRTELVLAILGAIPFGSLGKLAHGRQGLTAIAGDTFMAFKPSSWTAAAGQWNTLKTAFSLGGGGLNGLTSSASKLWTMSNSNGVGDILTRFMFGKDTGKMTDMIENMIGGSRGWVNSPVFPAAWEFTHMLLYSGVRTTDNIARIPGLEGASLTSHFPWLKIFK